MVSIPVHFVDRHEPEVRAAAQMTPLGGMKHGDEGAEDNKGAQVDKIEVDAESLQSVEDSASVVAGADDENSEASLGSGSTTGSAEETEAAMLLGRLAATLIELEKELKTHEERLKVSLAKSASVYWAGKAGMRTLAFDDNLDPQKSRTAIGKTVTKLNQLLLDVDQVGSFGNPVIRRARKSLVVKINDLNLPRAELLLQKAVKLIALDSSLRSTLKNHVKSNKQHVQSEQAPATPKPTDSSNTKQKDADKSPQAKKPRRNSLEHAAFKQDKKIQRDHCRTLRNEPMRRLEFDMDEQNDQVLLYAKLPCVASMKDVHLEVNRETGELLVAVRGFQPEKFDITHRSLLALRTSYQIDNGFLLIRVPKREIKYAINRCHPGYSAPQYLRHPFALHYR